MGVTLEARSAGAIPKSAVVSRARAPANASEPPVGAEIELNWIVGRREHAHDRRRGDLGEEQAEDARGGGDERAFDQHLLDQPASAGADRQAQGHLALARCGARQEQVGDVRTRDEQDQGGDRRQNPERARELLAQRRGTVGRRAEVERRPEEAGDALGRPLRPEGLGRVAADVREGRVQHALRLLEPDARVQAPDDPEPAEAGVAEGPRVVHRVRQPEIGRAARLDAREPRLGHADDLKLTVLECEPAAHDRGIAAEPPHPERMAQDRHRMRARPLVVLGGEQPADRRRDAQPVERVAGHDTASAPVPSRRRRRRTSPGA